MLTLDVFGPHFGLPDASPFCVKADVLLKLSGLDYKLTRADSRKAPKQKLPVLHDDAIVVADSTFIRMHLETQHGIDFDPGLTPADKGVAWAFEKLCEDHLYWATVSFRFMDDANFYKGPVQYFDAVPALLRPAVVSVVRRQVKRSLWGHGLGRHTRRDIEQLAIRGYAAIAAQLGDKPFLMGDKPCGADATIFAWVGSTLCPLFETPIRTAVEGHANLVAYRDRGLKLWYPEMVLA